MAISCKDKDTTVFIGGVFPLSGGHASYGSESRDGINLALEQINARGGVLGRKIAIIFEDDEGKAEMAVNAFSRLTNRDNVSIVIGSNLSGPTLAITPLAQRNEILLISPTATNIAVTQAGDFIFRACFIDPFQGVAGANFAYEVLGSRRAAILFDESASYNSGLAEAFKNQFMALGGQVAAIEAYQTGDTNFNTRITRIKAANPDLIYLPNYYSDVSIQAKQLREQGVLSTLIGGDAWDELINHAGDEVINCFWSAGFAADTTDPNGMAFVQAFEAQYNRPATQYAALSYDAMMLIADAITAAGTFDTSAVKDAMARINGNYATGNIRFDSDRNPIKGAVIIEIVKEDGRLVNKYKTTINR